MLFDFKAILNSSEFQSFYNIVNNELNSTNPHICINCHSESLIDDFKNGIIVCQKCGQVNNNIIDNTIEWKSFDNTKNDRCHTNINNLLNPTIQSNLHNKKLNQINSRNLISYKNQSLNKEFKIISNICNIAKIPKNIENDAKIIRKMISECKHNFGKNSGNYKIIRGNNRISINANTLYFACIKNNYAITISDIATLYNIKDKDMNKGFKNCKKMLQNDNVYNNNEKYIKSSHFIKTYCDKLKIKQEFIDVAIVICNNIDSLKLSSNHTPTSIASASILLMIDMYNINTITRKEIAHIFNLSDATVFKTFKIIKPYKNILINQTLVDQILLTINELISKSKIIPQNILTRFSKFNIII